ncbi:MAG: hypothetical protein COT81_05155 [Candidatus Buchananbacteria bacterium CG10_big_fil_rev_8_21_14_0_10_42_9]|uniref:Uncharacterized protein n=1 Tax=Candidatus Buchananbacteria bacterium CG10_big_fil_rev_8_21_14_0_10_42_9 TaxID=1974526 RepID=A0A2H0W234_9BACT|nr:MAG: hypothetical protein COT81_05155 [Candidatus Buchananbacteria bacterium CG10_big_fil_rev_8_21_14_0_10_42_9]
MKKLAFLLLLLAAPTVVMADTDHGTTVEQALTEVMSSQKAASAADINCSQVTDAQFETLGDAVMELMHPGEAHEQMDLMMGGEGSESLEAMHIQMGQNYLGCNTENFDNYFGSGGMMGPGMGGGMMNYSNKGISGGMMSGLGTGMMSFGYNGFAWITTILIWAVLVLAIMALLKYVTGKNSK